MCAYIVIKELFTRLMHHALQQMHILSFRLANGGEYLFQARDEEELQGWAGGLQAAAAGGGEGGAGGRTSQTLPPGSEKRDEPKRRSFFTLKKK